MYFTGDLLVGDYHREDERAPAKIDRSIRGR